MTPSKKYYWLRLKDDFFQQKEIKKLRKIAGGDTYTVIYLKMLLIAMKQDNKLYFEGVEDKFEEELALELDEEIDNVKMTLAFLKVQNLIEQITEEDFLLTKCCDMVGKETAGAERTRKCRQNKIENNNILLQCNTDVTISNTEIEKEKDIYIDINNNVHQDAQNAPSKKEINSFFELIWSLYPSKKGKANISDSKKKELFKYGDEIKIAIQRYIEFVEQTRKKGFALEYKNGSTFFNSGYVDYLDDNYSPMPTEVITKSNNSKLNSPNKFHNFEQRVEDYTPEQLEEIGRKNLEKKLKKLGMGGSHESAN